MKNKNLSANTVFHFTSCVDNLVSILKNGFYPQYCLEDIIHCLTENGSHLQYAVPMVCFCDIPLSQIQYHASKYGEYAIGLSKDWAKENKVNPVIYTYPKSAVTETLATNFLSFIENPCVETSQQIFPLLHHVKPYEGNLWKHANLKEENVRFYDEREWRYVPGEASIGIPPKNEHLNQEFFESKNSRMIEDVTHHLSFAPNDIRYLVVKKESEIQPFQKSVIEIMKEPSDEDIVLLTTRIISMETIIDDF